MGTTVRLLLSIGHRQSAIAWRMIHATNNDDATPPRSALPRYSTKSLLIGVACLAIVLSTSLTFLRYRRDVDVRRIFGGSTGVAVLRGADRVEVFRIGKLPDEFYWQDAVVADYPVLDGPIAVPASDAKQLASILGDPESYIWNSAKGCATRPGVRLDFIRGDDRLQILLCFECDILENFLNAKKVGGEDFDNVRSHLVRIVRPLLPNDPVIQSLPETH